LTRRGATPSAAGVNWLEIKDWLVDVTMLEKDALHIYAALILQLVASCVFKRGLASPWPLLVVLVAELGNEAYDIFFEIWPPYARERQWWMGIHDLVNTMAVPILLWTVARRPPANLSSDTT